MKCIRWIATVAAGLGMALPASAADLSKIDRSIAKQPEYESKQPTYCLLVFGLKADRRVWLVQDGNVLFIDRNGNGNLTEPNERLSLGPKPVFKSYATLLSIRNAATESEHEKLSVYYFGEWPTIYLERAGRGQSASTDVNGKLAFAPRPERAPVIHFGGPLTMTFDQPYALVRGDNPTDVHAMIGTAGIGPGSFASITHGHIANNLHPVLRIEFPSIEGKAIVGEYRLAERC